MAQVIAQLVLLLIAQHWECSNGGEELVVAESLETGNSLGRRTEGEGKRESQVLVAGVRMVQGAGADTQTAQPIRTERVAVIKHHVAILRAGRGSGRRQGALLHVVVIGRVVVYGSAQKPARFCVLRPIEAQRTDRVAEWNGSAVGNRD